MRTSRRSKYNAVRTTVDGVNFASQKEARRYRELCLLQKAGEISGLLLQPRYGLWVLPFATADKVQGELQHCGDYVGDFQYYDANGEKVIEDVKGVKTPVYRLKKKLVEALYGVTIQER